MIKSSLKIYNSEIIEAEYYGKIKYKVFGRLYTIFSNYKLNLKIKKRSEQNT